MAHSVCNGLNCESTKLIKAHIIPKGFGRIIRGEGPNVLVSLQRVRDAKPQLGEFDPEILCANCDNALGLFDDYAIEVCQKFEKNHVRFPNNIFEFSNFEGDKF